MEVMYDGTCFHGSQIQGDLPTVQLAVNKVLSTLLRTDVVSFGASRTDEGVHALCNYYHFDHETELHPDFLYKCNAILPQSMAVKRICKAASPEFNARFDARIRSYRYRIYRHKDPFLVNRAFYFPFPLREDVLQETAAIVKATTQFESFAKRNSQVKTMNCTILESRWEHVGNELHYVVVGNRFLRGMVRGLVGTQLHIARGNKTVADFQQIVAAQNCTKAFFNVPGHGLYLEHIGYPDGALIDLMTR